MNKIFNEMRTTEKWNIGYHTVLLEMCNDLINYGMHEGCTIMPNSTFQAIQQIRVLI